MIGGGELQLIPSQSVLRRLTINPHLHCAVEMGFRQHNGSQRVRGPTLGRRGTTRGDTGTTGATWDDTSNTLTSIVLPKARFDGTMKVWIDSKA